MAKGRKTNDTTANFSFEAKLCAATGALRNDMDAMVYGNLGLSILKYISVAFEPKHAELVPQKKRGADPESLGEYRADNLFWVPEEARWRHLYAQAPQPTIGPLVDDAMAAIGHDNPSLNHHRFGEFAGFVLANSSRSSNQLGETSDRIVRTCGLARLANSGSGESAA